MSYLTPFDQKEQWYEVHAHAVHYSQCLVQWMYYIFSWYIDTTVGYHEMCEKNIVADAYETDYRYLNT